MLLVTLLRTSLKSNLLTLIQHLVPLADMCVMHATVQASETATDIPTQNENMEGNWVPVCKPEEVPKGELRPVQCSSSNLEYVTYNTDPLGHLMTLVGTLLVLAQWQARTWSPCKLGALPAIVQCLSWPAGYRFEAKAAGVDVLLLWYRNQMYAIEQRWAPTGSF